jgi:hypothetical protein
MTAKEKPHYVNNRQFSEAVVEYCTRASQSKKDGVAVPVVPNYIAQCFLKIAEGLSHKSNFIRYTYREEMVMDAVENCLRAIENYNIETATRTGLPNAFAYFTQISWYAFLRRIAKEKKQQDVKIRYITQNGFESYLGDDTQYMANDEVVRAFVETLKERIDRVRDKDAEFKEYVNEEKRRKRSVYADSDLQDFMGD